ncbi:MAG: hypothetical protein M1561_06420 [Gammaproteobacteria bacterium]|nr:hypothetical protein [Gammaproteobacteria bacterium]
MRKHVIIGLLFSSMLFVFANVFAGVNVIISSAPAPQVIAFAPSGFSNCYNTVAGIENGVWIPSHRVCIYPNSPYGSAWVSGYWGCVSFLPFNGVCNRWKWYGHHWVRPGYREYGWHWYRPGPPPYPRPFPPRPFPRDFDRHGHGHHGWDGRGHDRGHGGWHH